MEREAMTTKARIAALQWFHDRGEVTFSEGNGGPTTTMIIRMICDGHLKYRMSEGVPVHSLTDKGRQDLHEATK